MADLAPMRKDIYERGENVAIVHSVGSENIEAWVRAVRGYAQVEAVDWHFIGGRARVAVLGTEDEVRRVREACRILLPALNEQVRALYLQLAQHGNPTAGVVIGAGE